MTQGHDMVHQHDLTLVTISAMLCLAGAFATSRFFRRLTSAQGSARYSWLVLSALASGVTIWCTHFVAMLGFDPGVPVGVDVGLTGVSLLIAVLGSAVGFLIAGRKQASRAMPALGGALVGLAVASMHYVGMAGYSVQGAIAWDMPRVVGSVVFAVIIAACALQAARTPFARSADVAALLLALSVLTLHFMAMSAMTVTPDMSMGDYTSPESLHGLAVSIGGLSFVTICAGTAGYLIDDRARAATMERFRRLALSDVLTGLPNRASFNERLDTEIQLARSRRTKLALIVVDVDNFKEINDLRGHSVGDEVLRTLGRRMGALTRSHEGAFIARIGGDEFVATYPFEGRHALHRFLADLRVALTAVVRTDSQPITPRASIGAAIFPDDAADAESLINNADLAMYRAKADTLRDLFFYDAAVDEQTRARRGLGADLREALARDELSLHYQVQTAVATGEIRGYEALLRWRHGRLGPVPPGEFIPLAEESGLIVPIGDWVLRQACAEAVRWDVPYRVAVNVSAVQLADPELPAAVARALAQSGLAAERLELELTETAVFADRERALLALQQIKALGVGIALDDFGVGYSSLAALRTFPFDRIKIDRSFFSDSGTTEQTLEIVQAVLSLGRTFGMSVLAEGIETEDQLALLTETGCDEAQGYLFGAPTAPDQLVRTTRAR